MKRNDNFEVTADQQDHFRDEGFILFEDCLSATELDALQGGCAAAISNVEARMDAAGTDVSGINHRGKRYFEPAHPDDFPSLRDVYFDSLAATILKATLGPDAYLFLAQYTVKCGDVGLKFSWHQDSGYIGFPHPPTINLWCALDDMTEENGTLHLLPYSRAGTRELVPHRLDPETNDLTGYFGDDPGDPLVVSAGTVLAFSSTVFHRSGPNRTPAMRRAITIEYTKHPLINPESGEQLLWAIPFLADGKTDNCPFITAGPSASEC